MRHFVNPRQGRLFDPFDGLIPPLGRERIHNGWQAIFRTALLELMPAHELAKHFSATFGRPTKELYSVAGLLFLQEFQNWTIPEAVEAYLFRTDIQFALNLEPGSDQMCERTYERYRALFLEDEGAGRVMQKVTDRLIDLLEIDIRKQRLDSTHVFSNMASFGRTRLMAVTIKRFLTQVKRHHLADFEALPLEMRKRYAPSQAQLLSKESKDADGRARSRQQVAEDLRALIDCFADHAGLRERPSYQALVTVFAQQCEIVDDRVTVRTKTGGACLQNPSDLEATYDGKKGPGYQVQFSETCADGNEVQLIVAALPQTAVESDANALLPVLEDLQARDQLPEEMLADTSYGSDENVQQAAALNVEVVSPVSGPKMTTSAAEAAADTNAGTDKAVAKLSIDDFAIDERTGKVEACPSGRIPLNVVYEAATNTTTIHMSPEDCTACPFRAQCPIEPGEPTCKVSYTDKQRRLEGRRREQATDVFRERYAKRSGLESTNSGIKRRLGLGQLRVRGRRAVNHALYLKVAGWNLLRAAASGKLRGRVAAALAHSGAALWFCLVFIVQAAHVYRPSAHQYSRPEFRTGRQLARFVRIA
jgi:DDE family transposase